MLVYIILLAFTSFIMSNKARPNVESNIYNDYFTYTKHNKSLYGNKCVVLMQVGAFFEVYGVKDSLSGETSHSNIVEFGDVCQLNISEKKANFGNGVVVMAGFRDYTLDKYIAKLTDAGYTIPVYIQEKIGKEITRKLSQVYSSGTYISCDTDSSPQITNHIMCIWMDTFKPFTKSTNMRETIVYGVSVVNIFTGKSSMFQYETQFFMNMTTFDELERYVSIFSPSEVIILSPFDDKMVTNIMQLTGLNPQMIHKVAIPNTNSISNEPNQSLEKVSRCMNQKYIKQILSTFFGDEAFDVCSEFRTHNMATQSYCYLLNFIQEHNPDLVRKISIPEFNNTSCRMILANHTLSQLNIINDDTVDSKKSGKLSCVLSFLNKCCSPMGKRRFQSQLLNPTFDEEWLNAEYKMTNFILNEHYYFVDMFRSQLFHMRDIEKLCRQLILKKVYPASIYHLYNTIKNIQQINTCLFELPQVCDYLCNDFTDNREPAFSTSNEYINKSCTIILDFLDNHLFIDNCKAISSMFNFEVNIIRPGISAQLDATILNYNENLEQFNKIHKYFNSLMQKSAQDNNAEDMEYIKIHETDKSGSTIQITTRRSLILKNILANLLQTGGPIIKLDSKLHIPINDIKFTKSTASTMEIDFPLLNQICKELLADKETINVLINEAYLIMLANFEKDYYVKMENIASFVSKIDILQAKTYVAKTNNYCCPVIVADAAKSFVDARELRHCLIEHLQQNEIYVTNDMALGQDFSREKDFSRENAQSKDVINGILLFGTNAVGKTSLIRALGVAVIMAQAGMFVPCSQFIFKPYTAIFSRILGNDNLFKGLSTFAVEMTELRIILKMADDNSLILGDELCSGTETESALSIFVAGLMNLHAKQSSFIFATHFHEIIDYDEITNLDKLSMKHMAVVFDREHDCLIYDRKLKDGSGPKTYGLEVCKSLYLGDEFLDSAYAIRNKYYPETRGNLSLKPTTYNQEKIRGMCEICGTKMGEEIHHLSPQRDADKNGFIGTFHKNHKANLVSICETCHDKIHENDHSPNAGSQLSRKKTTKGYKVV